jgi:plasmid maintenance system antidote protein VapI
MSGIREPHAMRAIIARNLRALMDLRRWNQSETSRRSGVSQRHISEIVNERTDVTTGVLDKLAVAFGRHGYELQIDGLHEGVADSTGNLARLVSAYVQDPEVRKFLDAAYSLAIARKST